MKFTNIIALLAISTNVASAEGIRGAREEGDEMTRDFEGEALDEVPSDEMDPQSRRWRAGPDDTMEVVDEEGYDEFDGGRSATLAEARKGIDGERRAFAGARDSPQGDSSSSEKQPADPFQSPSHAGPAFPFRRDEGHAAGERIAHSLHGIDP